MHFYARFGNPTMNFNILLVKRKKCIHAILEQVGFSQACVHYCWYVPTAE